MSAGNINAKMLVRYFERGLAAEGRLIKFKCILQDVPNGMKKLYDITSDLGITIKEVKQDRAWQNDLLKVEVC